MKTTNTLLHIFIFLFLYGTFCRGQQGSGTLSLDNSPIEEQFQYVYQKSSDFEEFKMVKRWYLTRLKTHVLDTLKNKQEQLNDARNLLSNQTLKIDSLVSVIDATNKNLNTAVKEKNSFTLLGISMQKAGYNSIIWSVIAGLTFVLLVLILLYKRSYIVITQTKSNLDETRLEFEAFRKRALEREEGIVRKYHDELMKYKSKVNNV